MRFRHEVLQAARLELGLTQEELAESLGVAVRTYRRYESGAVNAGGFTLRNASRQGLLDRMNAELGTSRAELVETETNAQHVLQPARHFVGRASDLDRLRAFCDSGAPGILAVVGVGGAGKTALVEHYLRVRNAELVYSFYEDRRVAPFLQAAAKLNKGALVVLDGVEVLQVAFADGFAHGELTEPALRDWLRGVAAGQGSLQVIATSRFPLVDMEVFSGRGFNVLELGPLADDDVTALLGAWGVEDTAELGTLAGGHALSAAVLGSYVGGFLQGELPAGWRFEEAASDDPLARRLQAVLSSYRHALPDDTVAVLTRLADAPSGAAAAKEDRVHLRRLVRLGLVFTLGGERFAMHPFVRDALRARSEDQATLKSTPGMARTEKPALLKVESELQRALDDDDIAAAVTLYRRELGGFDQLGLKLGDYARGRRVLAQLEPRLEGQRGTLGERSVARLIYDQGLYSGALGDLKHAIRCYERIVERAGIDVALRTTALRAQAYSLRLLGDADQALAVVDEAITLSEAAGERPHEGRAHALRGAILSDLGEGDEAGGAFERSEELSGPMVARRALWRAEFELLFGDVRAARARTLSNLRICEELRWPGHVAHCQAVLAFAALEDGEGDVAPHLRSLRTWTERTNEAEFVARADALAHRLDPSCGARESFLSRPSTRELRGLQHWFTPRE